MAQLASHVVGGRQSAPDSSHAPTAFISVCKTRIEVFTSNVAQTSSVYMTKSDGLACALELSSPSTVA